MSDERKAGSSEQENQRVIRVFISSTFRDMMRERDYLVKFIFPQLRRLCDLRGVIWGEVDLRWGVTDEQAAEGKVLPICLEEIKRCRPYFIGLLGERYGWIPDLLPADLLEREPWLEEHLHGKTSVTELEILHGVLRNPMMAGHAFFYFRDPKYVETFGDDEKKTFISENAKSTEKLSDLKDNIRHSGFPVRENYPDPKALGELVLADLTKVINDNWPEGSQPDPLDRLAMDHEAYAQSRERVYIGRQKYFDRLNTFAAANDTQPLVILGESGSGKSALLANWVARYGQTHPDTLVLQHYIGATSYSTDWVAMLQRLMGEFKRRLGLQQDIPDQPDALCSAFPNWLYMAAAKGRVVLVLDALNQLEDRDGAPDLVWLPPVLPENVRLIVSTLPGRPLDEIQKRNWPTFKVELLSTDERRKLIAEYLAQHAKSLNAARVECIAAAPPSSNPLYLRVLLDELRLVRTHEELEERIGDYMKAESPYALYERVIARWKQDYEGESDLVGDTLLLLWAARRGLTETELLQAMGKDDEPLSRAKWSPLFLAMSDALISRGGLLTFAHDFLRTAVKNAYLPTEQNQQRAHLRLANYFDRQPANPRRTDELPWQLMNAAESTRLSALLCTLAFLEGSWTVGYFDIEVYWAFIERTTDVKIANAYSAFLADPSKAGSQLWQIARLLRDFHYLKESLHLCNFLISQERAKGNSYLLRKGLAERLVNLWGLQNHQAAFETCQELETLSRQGNDYHHLGIVLDAQATILDHSGAHEQALQLETEAENICRETGDALGLQRVIGNKASILQRLKRFEEALKCRIDQESICRQLGHVDGLMISLYGQAHLILSTSTPATVDFAKVDYLLSEQERISRQYGKKGGLVDGLSLQSQLFHGCADIFARQGNFERALELLRRQNQVCSELKNYRGVTKEDLLCVSNLVASLINYAAQLSQNRGRANEAESLVEEALELASGSPMALEIAPVVEIIRKHSAYQKALAQWQALPIVKRAFVRKPSPPEENFQMPAW